MTENTEPTPNQDRIHLLIVQYEQRWSDRRYYEQMIWQTPTISLGIIAILVSIVFAYRVPRMLQFLVYFLGTLISLVGTIQLRKHRFFSIASNGDLVAIQQEIHQICPQLAISAIKFKTADIIHDKTCRYNEVQKGWFDRRLAYNWLWGLMVISTIGLAILAVGALISSNTVISFYVHFVSR